MAQQSPTDGYRPIADYALIGDCRSAALISTEGSIDWLCWPRFDSPFIFGALLDAQRGGRFRVKPCGPYRAERRYVPYTNVLETVFTTSTGSFALRDLFPVLSEPEKQRFLVPDHELLRELRGLAGEVQIEVYYQPRPDYGRCAPIQQQRGGLGWWSEARGAALLLQSDVPLARSGDGTVLAGTARLHAGDRRYLSLAYSHTAPAVVPPLGETAQHKVHRSVQWWQQWASRCTYQGPYRDAVLRSALALKLLTYAPSGAVVAAPTTSLPERIGGVRNWDYRYCWLRDASFILRALFALGYREEAEAFMAWSLHATRLTWPELHVMYDVFGEARLPEVELSHLEGYAGSRPVRIGNGAEGQLQLDVYGEVIDAVARFVREGGRFDRETQVFLDDLGRTVCRRWREPDEGIWEGRAGRFHHTHSKVLCWVALDRLVEMHEHGHIQISVDRYRAERELVRAAIEEHGYNEALGCYTRTFDGEELDAALLTLPLYGYIDGTNPRMLSTCRRIHERLAKGPFIYRYHTHETDDGLPPGEGAFGVCSFWGVECLARGGHIGEAVRAFERLLECANDVGLFAEEIDPSTGAALGNFPQGLTHLGLINAAVTLGRYCTPE